MRHLILSIILGFSVSTVFAGDADNQENKAAPKCTTEHVPIVLKTENEQSYTVFVKKNHAKHLKSAKGLKAMFFPATIGGAGP